MILAVDIGNTRLKCAVLDNNGVLGRESVSVLGCRDATVLSDVVRRVSGAVLAVEGVLISSVVPSLNRRVEEALKRQTGMTPVLIDHSSRFPFEIGVPEPSRVGTDRLCAAAGAMGTTRRNGIIIDAGSAITVDLVRDGRFAGGVIAAGPSISLLALNRYASKLPAVGSDRAETLFPKTFDSTESSMSLGAGLGAVGVIRESVRHLESSAGTAPPKYLTGGFSDGIRSRLPRSWRFDPDLVVKGIHVVYTMGRAAGEV